MKIEKAFGAAIKIRRSELAMNQEELADKTGLARSFVSGIERGQANPSMNSILALAKALECQPSDLWVLAEKISSER